MDTQKLMKTALEDWGDELNEDMRLNKFNLDDECARQTSIFSKWAMLSAQASQEREWRQKELDEETARLDNEIRADPEKFGLRDIKENAVKALITSDGEIMKLRADLIRAISYSKFFNSAVEACDQKKYMLRELGNLWLGEYYSNVEIRKGEAEDDLRERMGSRKTGRK